MAIAATSLGTLGSTSNAQNFDVTLQRAPAANALVLVAFSHSDTAPENIASAVTSDDMVFSLVTQVVYDTIASNVHRLEVWRCMRPTAPTATVVHINLGDAGTGCAANVVEFSGVSTSGTSGANAVGFSRVSNINASSSVTLLLASFTSGANGVFVCGAHDLNVATDGPNADYIKLDATNYNTPATGLSSGWTKSSLVTVCKFSGTGSGTTDRAAIAVELVADNPAAGGARFTPYYLSHYQRLVRA